MTNSQNSKLDQMIASALSDRDQEVLAETRELGYFALGLSQFGGPLGWVTWIIMILQATMFLAGLYCGVQFFAATEIVPALKWGLSAAVLVLMALQIKLSLAPQMQADRIIREIKRVELLVVSQAK
ncbi:MAG: DUF6768 family protein [Pseudomonadota bacterium]